MTNDAIERFIAELREEADTSPFPDLAAPAIALGTRRSPLSRLRTRAAAATASILLAVGGLGGVAYAADGAVPGDFLYGIDRALEAVGIGNGGATERLEEIGTLIEDDRPEEALELATDLVEADSAATTALQQAADRIAGLEHAASGEQVAALLTYLSDNVGSIDGPTVAELARSIGPGGPPDGVTPGQGSQGTAPGHQNTPGPPEGVTPQGSQGTAPGHQNTPGPPDDGANPGGQNNPGHGGPFQQTPGDAAGGKGNGRGSGRMNP